MTSTFLSKTGSFLRRQGRALRLARKGNVAMIFALAVVPLVVAGGSGIDLARSLAVRGKLYSAVDAAALAVASKVGITQAQATVLAQQYFDANYNLDGSFGAPDPVNVTITGQRVTVTSDIAMPTTLMNIAGIHDVNLTASSEVVWGQTKIWVGLALDNTGSMCSPGGSQPCAIPSSSSKLYALKVATKSLLTMFESVSANAGDVQVSLIPFAKDVNAGAANHNATWIDWTDWDAANGQCVVNSASTSHSNQASCESADYCSISGNNNQSSCQSAHACTVGGVISTTILTQTACNLAGGSWGPGVWTANAGVWTSASHATWNGCIADRGLTSGPSSPAYDASNASPNAAPESKFPAEQWNSCPTQLMALGYNWTALDNKVDAMVGVGNTNQSIGLAWAWQSLSQGSPLSPPALPAGTTRHIIILSDGENTQNRWSSNRAAIDARMNAVCTAAKADGIVVWSVFVDIGGAGSATSMENCATGGVNGGHYIEVTSAAGIGNAFNVIGQQITNLRIAH